MGYFSNISKQEKKKKEDTNYTGGASSSSGGSSKIELGSGFISNQVREQQRQNQIYSDAMQRLRQAATEKVTGNTSPVQAQNSIPSYINGISTSGITSRDNRGIVNSDPLYYQLKGQNTAAQQYQENANNAMYQRQAHNAKSRVVDVGSQYYDANTNVNFGGVGTVGNLKNTGNLEYDYNGAIENALQYYTLDELANLIQTTSGSAKKVYKDLYNKKSQQSAAINSYNAQQEANKKYAAADLNQLKSNVDEAQANYDNARQNNFSTRSVFLGGEAASDKAVTDARQRLQQAQQEYNLANNYQYQQKASDFMSKDYGARQLLLDYAEAVWMSQSGDSTMSGTGASRANTLKQQIMAQTGWDENTFNQYAGYAKSYYNQQKTNAAAEKLQGFADKAPVTATIASSMMNMVSGIPGTIDLAKQAANSDGSTPIDQNSRALLGTNAVNAIRNEVGQNLQYGNTKLFGLDLSEGAWNTSKAGQVVQKALMGDQQAAQFVYGTITSSLDSAMYMVLGGAGADFAAGLAEATGASAGAIQMAAKVGSGAVVDLIMGSSVAATKTMELLNEGYTADKAISAGILEGAVEGFTEAVSVEMIIDAAISDKTAFRKLVKGFLSEGGEEVAANWLDRAVETAVFGNEQKFLQEYQSRVDAGMSKTAALADALWASVIQEDVGAFLAGGLSGAGMGGTAIAGNAVGLYSSLSGMKNATDVNELTTNYAKGLDVTDEDSKQRAKVEQTYKEQIAQMDNGVDLNEYSGAESALNTLRNAAVEMNTQEAENTARSAAENDVTRLEGNLSSESANAAENENTQKKTSENEAPVVKDTPKVENPAKTETIKVNTQKNAQENTQSALEAQEAPAVQENQVEQETIALTNREINDNYAESLAKNGFTAYSTVIKSMYDDSIENLDDYHDAMKLAYRYGRKNNNVSIDEIMSKIDRSRLEIMRETLNDAQIKAAILAGQEDYKSENPAPVQKEVPVSETNGEKPAAETNNEISVSETENEVYSSEDAPKENKNDIFSSVHTLAEEIRNKGEYLVPFANVLESMYNEDAISDKMAHVHSDGSKLKAYYRYMYEAEQYGINSPRSSVDKILEKIQANSNTYSIWKDILSDEQIRAAIKAGQQVYKAQHPKKITKEPKEEKINVVNNVEEVSDGEAVQQPAVSGESDNSVLGGLQTESSTGNAEAGNSDELSGERGNEVSGNAARPDEIGNDGLRSVGSNTGGNLQSTDGTGSGESVQSDDVRGKLTEAEEKIEKAAEEGIPETAAAPIDELPEETQREIKQDKADSVEPKGRDYIIPEEGLKLPNGEKARYKANVAAIKTVKAIIAENRFATYEEQAVLSKYVGWGGLSNAFDARKSEWAKEYKELSSILTKEEYEAAKHSTLNAHFTEIGVIRSIYKGLESLGFTGGTVLEPSAGVGNFAGAMPESMRNNIRSMTMVELDTITGNITKALYPNMDVRVQGFETANIPDNYMDLAISNVPFGNYAITDKKYPKSVTSAIHNYFFAKSLDKVHPGGIVCFITSRYTMDSRDTSVRKYISERANLLGAIRLPDSAFKGNAGTEVVTDIIVLQKREPGTPYSGEQFVDTSSNYLASGIYEQTNNYFASHPEMVLGTAEKTGGMYTSNQLTYKAIPGKTLTKQIEKAFSKINGKIEYQKKVSDADIMKQARAEIRNANSKTKEGSYVKQNGKIFRNENGELIEQELDRKTEKIISASVDLRDTARQLLTAQQTNSSEKEIKSLRDSLNAKYDAFVKENGLLNKASNKRIILNDADGPFILSLENYDAETKTASKSDVFTKNTVTPRKIIEHVDNIYDGVSASINETGTIDVDMISRLMGKTPEETTRELISSRNAFKTPNNGLQPRQAYLSGNVRAKLKEAESLSLIDADYKNNVEELIKVVPADIPAQDISVQLGATWIPTNVYADFAAELLGGSNSGYSKSVEVTYTPALNTFVAEFGRGGSWLKGNAQDVSEYGTSDKSFMEIFNAALNHKDLKVYFPHGKDERAVLNRTATIAVKEKKNLIQSKFQEWMWSNEKRVNEYAPLYNDTFNCMAIPEYDGSTLSIDGLSADITLREHQANAVQRIIMSGGNVLLAHGTGTGKTLEMASACMKLRQIGAIKKPIITVPKNLLSQWPKEFYKYYPGAKILVPGENDFTPARRKMFANKIATGDYDAVILSYEQFEKIPLSADIQKRYLEEERNSIILAIEASKAASGKRYTVKQLEKKKISLDTRINALNEISRDEGNINFEDLGVDSLFVDEAHNFKNLFYNTQMSGVADLGNKDGSKRAFDLYMKVNYLQQLNGGRGIVFGTATPIMNSVVEMFTMQRYLQGPLLRQRGINDFDAWVSEFGEVQDIQKMKSDGTGWEVKQSLSKYRNTMELQQMYRSFADVQPMPKSLADKLPKLKTGGAIVVECEPSEIQLEYMKNIGERADAIRNRKVDTSEDNLLKLYGDGKKMSYTQKMIDPSLPYEEGGKILTCIDYVTRKYKDTSDNKGVQLIFCDRGVPGGKDAENGVFIYKDMKNMLVASGIPAEEIAFAQDYKTDAAKSKMQQMVNDGEIRVLIGSTQAMGTGLNIQKRCCAMYELNCPDRPGDIEQNRGRMIRQGNMYSEVELYTFITKKTFDSRQWDNQKRKSAFIHQVQAGDYTGRTADGDGDFSLSAAEISAIATGNPLIVEQNELSQKISNLEALELSHTKSIQEAKRKTSSLNAAISKNTALIEAYKTDISRKIDVSGENFKAEIDGKQYTKRSDAGKALIEKSKSLLNIKADTKSTMIGAIGGLDIFVTNKGEGYLRGAASYNFSLNFESPDGTMQSITSALKYPETRLEQAKKAVSEFEKDIEKYEQLAKKTFDKAEELASARKRFDEINEILNPSAEQGVDTNVEGTSDFAPETEYADFSTSESFDSSEMWKTKRTANNTTTAKTGVEIVSQIEHDFGINITEGHLRGTKSLGRYYNGKNGIRIKEAEDIPTIAHELGHGIDDRYGIINADLTENVKDELMEAFGELPKKKYKTKKAQLKEGFAEYLRYFLQNRDAATVDYPSITELFMTTISSEDRVAIERLADEVNAYYSDETATSSIINKEDLNIDYRTRKERIEDKTDAFYQNWVDSNHAIKRLVDSVGGRSDAYILATNSAYSNNIAHSIVFNDLTNAEGEYVGPGLKTALTGVNTRDPIEYKAFGEYLTCLHGQEWLERGLQVFENPRKNTAEWMQARLSELDEKYPAFKGAAKRTIKFMHDFTYTWGVENGLMDSELFEELEEIYPNYVPFYRAVEKNGVGNYSKRGFANQSSPYKRAKGSGRTIINPVDNIINQVSMTINTAVRNNVMLSVTEAAIEFDVDANFMEKVPEPLVHKNINVQDYKSELEDVLIENYSSEMRDGVMERIISSIENLPNILEQYERGIAKGNVVSVMRDGKREYWKINDPMLLESLTSLSGKKSSGFMQLAGAVTRFMTMNITGNNVVWSVMSNAPRDFGTFAAMSDDFLKNFGKYMKGYVETYKNGYNMRFGDKEKVNPIYLQYIALGGDRTDVISTSRGQRNLRKSLTDTKINNLLSKMNPINITEFISSTIERGPRYATFQFLVENGVDAQTAFYEAMDRTTNFAKHGIKGADLNKLIPFSNATIQGTDKFFRYYTAADANPEERSQKSRTRIITLLTASAVLAGLTILLNLPDKKKKEEYEQLSTYTKNNYFCIPIGDGKYFTIPKPREVAFVETFMERTAEAVAGNKDAFYDFTNYITDMFLPSGVSNIAEMPAKMIKDGTEAGMKDTISGVLGSFGVFGVATNMMSNRDFLGRPIESSSLEKLEPKDRYNGNTSKMAYWIGQAFNLSPQMIDYFGNQVFGYIWKYPSALLPMDSERRDLSLGVKKTYIKDSEYSTDVVNHLYDKAEKSQMKAQNGNVDDKIQNRLDSNMTAFYGKFYKLNKEVPESKGQRDTRQKVLTLINDYLKADGETTTPELEAIINLCKQTGETKYLPAVMNTYIKDASGTEYTLTDAQYYEYQTSYNAIYYNLISSTLDTSAPVSEQSATVLAAREIAKDRASIIVLSKISGAEKELLDKYDGLDDNQIILYKAAMDIANDGGTVKQSEYIDVINSLGLTEEESSILFHIKYSSDKNNPWAK